MLFKNRILFTEKLKVIMMSDCLISTFENLSAYNREDVETRYRSK